MHEVWKDLKSNFYKSYNENYSIEVDVGSCYCLYIWAGKNIRCKPQEFRHFEMIDSYLEYEVYIHKILSPDEDHFGCSLRKDNRFSRCLYLEERTNLGLNKYSNYEDEIATFFNGDSVKRYIFLPKKEVENIYDILIGKTNNIKIKTSEKACKNCSKPNDLDVDSCWWCCTKDPTKYV